MCLFQHHQGTVHATQPGLVEKARPGMPLCEPSPDKEERMQLRILSVQIPVPRDPPARTHIPVADKSAWRLAWPQGHTFYRLIDLRQIDTRPGGAYALFRRWPGTGMKSRASQGPLWSTWCGPWGSYSLYRRNRCVGFSQAHPPLSILCKYIKTPFLFLSLLSFSPSPPILSLYFSLYL
jgi:hypothetical protein